MLLMLSVCAAGLLPPWIAVNARLVGLALMADGTGAAVTVKETGIVTGGAPECAESNGLTIAAWGQGAGHHIGCDHTGAGAGGWTEGQPRCTIAGSPVQGALTGIVDSQDLGRRAGLSLLSRKG